MSTQFPSDNLRAEESSRPSIGPSTQEYSKAKTTLQNDFLTLDTNPDKVREIYYKITQDIDNYQNLINQSGGDTTVANKLSTLQESLITLASFPSLLSNTVDSTKVSAANVSQVKEAFNTAINIISSLNGNAKPIDIDLSIKHYFKSFAIKVSENLDAIRNFNGDESDPPIENFVENLKNDLKKYNIILKALELPPDTTPLILDTRFDDFIGTNGILDNMFSDIRAKNQLAVSTNWNTFYFSDFNKLCNASMEAICGPLPRI